MISIVKYRTKKEKKNRRIIAMSFLIAFTIFGVSVSSPFWFGAMYPSFPVPFSEDWLEKYAKLIYDYRIKMIGDPPFLKQIHPNPDSNGFIRLEWDYLETAKTFHVWRSDTSESEGYDWKNVGNTTLYEYVDGKLENGEYYYCLTSSNLYGMTNQSNIESVIVLIPSEEDFEEQTEEPTPPEQPSIDINTWIIPIAIIIIIGITAVVIIRLRLRKKKIR